MKELKQLLKQPFEWTDTGAIKLTGKQLSPKDDIFIDVIGANEHYEDIIGFVVAALNEKWDRDFSETMRWELINDLGEAGQILKCKKCEQEVFFQDWSIPRNYCPNCGRRLLSHNEKAC
jgi:DNA-directed RNA polymerase subunit RPC12/RpoP